MPSICRYAVTIAALATPAAPVTLAEAREWRIEPPESRIAFEYESDGEPSRGTFGTFSGVGRFDRRNPDDATFTLRIRTESIDLGDARANAFATSAEWFDSANHPDIVYELQDLTHLEADRYRAIGDLTIRGNTRAETTTIDLEIGEAEAHASGTLTVDRKDYGLGVGPMSMFVEIGPKVSVHFELTARPAE